jgi:tetratricopeptide (TPR) repeat protein
MKCRMQNVECRMKSPAMRRAASEINSKILFLFILVFAILYASVSFASGEGAAKFYNEGNAAFLKGDYNAAAESYQAARGQGADDARLLYNLGCAYLKAGKAGPAIQQFEMARARSPRDEDIRLNLEFARSRIKDELPETDTSFIVRATSFPVRIFTFGELILAAGAVFCAAFLIIGIFWSMRREKRGLAGIIVGLCLLALSFLIAFYAGWQHLEYGGHRAIVAAKELPVKSGPGVDNPTLFTVHEGLQAKVREVRDTWSFIEIPTGFKGWVPNDSLLPIG